MKTIRLITLMILNFKTINRKISHSHLIGRHMCLSQYPETKEIISLM
jgi:hypothetical protein